MWIIVIILYDTAFPAKLLILAALNFLFKTFIKITYTCTVHSGEVMCAPFSFEKPYILYAWNVLPVDTDHILIITEPRELLSSLIFQGGELNRCISDYKKRAVPN